MKAGAVPAQRRDGGLRSVLRRKEFDRDRQISSEVQDVGFGRTAPAKAQDTAEHRDTAHVGTVQEFEKLIEQSLRPAVVVLLQIGPHQRDLAPHVGS